MPKTRTAKEFYTEAEAAASLEISIETLHHLLDRHIFNGLSPRPTDCTFRQADLTLLRFWLGDPDPGKVIAMPSRAAAAPVRPTGTGNLDSKR